MRSGKGRHRRPRQAPALLVTAGVAGAGIATSLLGASGAQAVEASTWDSVAQCESGGAWSLNKENGYYGGLQLTLKSWEAYGGTEFADRPDLASRGQQIRVAEKILAAEGPRAWPACAVDSGLEEEVNEAPDLELPLPGPDKGGDEDSDDADSDDADSDDDGKGDADEDDADEDAQKPGDSDSDDSDDADDSEDADEKERPDNSDGSDSPKPPGDTSVPSPDEREQDTDPDPEHSSGAGSGSGNSDAAEEEVDNGKGAGDPSGGHDGRIGTDDPDDPTDGAAESDPGSGSGKHRGRPDPAEKDRADRSGRDDGHLVEIGDTLTSIAERHELAGGWPELYETNRPAVGEDPDHILPGQLLQLGEEDDAETSR
ncbi:LysM peptidoglycan-binding domain-containing protein [Streptomyces sp. P38-E01]|uniref:LysM peptidoglycan-binding domain-containing protein n=1 Tax=Streptomyces tardus TaxID=2780544 RepID=A0A949JGN1_9ACTN|nr:transglycosylase family protein [Streptomyces tardus]MBU7598573.1 LysM peptidoglycan-binding domain-containing protein [Streptomyces tardus]